MASSATDNKFTSPVDIRDGATTPGLDPNRSMSWSIPPVLSENPASKLDQGFVLTQGVVYEIRATGTYMFQNVSQNEDDQIEFSLHGEPEGFWNLLPVGAFLKASDTFYLLNRTHKSNCKVAVVQA